MRLNFKKSYLLIFLVLVGCSDGTGTVEVKWDRDSCERCRMVISDRHFAVQVRGGPRNKIYLFDDIGCAVHWLNDQEWGKGSKIWVADYRSGQWLDAYTAHYVVGQITPMNFGLGAIAKPVKGSMDFATAKTQLLLNKHQHISQ